MIKKNSKLVDIFNSGLKDLEEEIKKMSKKERKWIAREYGKSC